MTDHQGITNREKPKSQIAGKRTSNPRFPADPITSSAPNYQAFSGVRGFFTGDGVFTVTPPSFLLMAPPTKRKTMRVKSRADSRLTAESLIPRQGSC